MNWACTVAGDDGGAARTGPPLIRAAAIAISILLSSLVTQTRILRHADALHDVAGLRRVGPRRMRALGSHPGGATDTAYRTHPGRLRPGAGGRVPSLRPRQGCDRRRLHG